MKDENVKIPAPFCHHWTHRLKSDGNFGIMTALLLPVLLGAGGLAIDVANQVLASASLKKRPTAAALAAARHGKRTITIADAQTVAVNFVAGQMSNYHCQRTRRH